MAKGKSGRDCVALFAGHIAHLLNGDDRLEPDVPDVEVAAFFLYDALTNRLARNPSYRDKLVGHWAYRGGAAPEESAEYYFKAVLERPIQRRGTSESTADRLREFLRVRGRGLYAAGTTDSLSAWTAMVDGPPKIKRCDPPNEVFALSNLILKCLDACNRPYAEILRLGLDPRDWLGENEIAVNRLKAANGYVKVLKEICDAGISLANAEMQSKAWAIKPVPGYPDAEAFAASGFGAAILRADGGGKDISYESVAEVLADADADDVTLSDGEDASQGLSDASSAGAISAAEAKLMEALLGGTSLADALEDDGSLAAQIDAEWDGDIGAYVSDLSERMAEHAQARIAEGADHPVREGGEVLEGPPP